LNKEIGLPKKRLPLYGELSRLSLLLIAVLFVRLLFSFGLEKFPPSEALSLAAPSLCYLLAFGLLPLWYLQAVGRQPKDVLCYRPSPLKHPILTAFASLTAVQLTGIAANQIVRALGGDGAGAVSPDALPSSPLPIAVFFLNTVLLPPLFEEAFCRGLVIKRLLPYGRGIALFVSSLVFALLHATPVSMVYAFIGGLIYGSVTLKTGSLLPSTLLHLTQNGFSFLLMLSLRVFTTPNGQTIAGLAVCLILLIGIAGGLVLLIDGLIGRRKKKGKRHEVYLPKGNVFTSFGFWLFLFFALSPLF